MITTWLTWDQAKNLLMSGVVKHIRYRNEDFKVYFALERGRIVKKWLCDNSLCMVGEPSQPNAAFKVYTPTPDATRIQNENYGIILGAS